MESQHTERRVINLERLEDKTKQGMKVAKKRLFPKKKLYLVLFKLNLFASKQTLTLTLFSVALLKQIHMIF